MKARWISDLQVGDDVIVAGVKWTLAKVSCMTEDYIVANGVLFYRDTGVQVAGVRFKGRKPRLMQATPDRVLSLKPDSMTSKIEDFDGWRMAIPGEIEAVFAIVEKIRGRRD
jgi:hypothetical protein